MTALGSLSNNIDEKLSELEALLDRENRALSGPDNTVLVEIADKKERILQSLSTDINGGAAQRDDHIATRLELCRCRNSENNQLLNQRLRVIRDVNQIIRQQTGHHGVALYDGYGNLERSVNSKSLSEA
jgi:flagellar biosynthesis/type III secretory pathway chaperone